MIHKPQWKGGGAVRVRVRVGGGGREEKRPVCRNMA